MSTTIIGISGGNWRAVVNSWGGLEIPGADGVEWWVAADDRWHTPRTEPSIRQRTLDGTPVVETRLKVPQGDVIQRVYAAATAGGVTILEFENDSPLPVAIAVNRRDLLTARPPSDLPPQGIDLPAGSTVHPVGHRATLRLGIAHGGTSAGPLPSGVPSAVQVARGWTTHFDRASRLVLPDVTWSEAIARTRSDLLLEGLDDPDDDPIATLLGIHELARLGIRHDWAPEVASAAERVARGARRDEVGWDEDRALLAAGAWFLGVGDRRAAADVRAARQLLGRRTGLLGATPPDGVRRIAWIEDLLLREIEPGVVEVFPDWLPASWDGNNFECYRVPAGTDHTVSFAVRWHGENPALLWETDGPSGLLLRASGIGSRWTSSEPAGETLLTDL